MTPVASLALAARLISGFGLGEARGHVEPVKRRIVVLLREIVADLPQHDPRNLAVGV